MKRTNKVLPRYLAQVIEEYHLEALDSSVNLEGLAKKWGVKAIEEHALSSEGLILPTRGGYKIIINEEAIPTRRRFSLAHELGHLLLHKSGISDLASPKGKQRGSLGSDWDEERLCDQIAAEILMPKMVFYEDGWMEGWSLKSLRTLASMYKTSLSATAVRMVDLMPEEALMGVWRVSEEGKPTLQWPHSGKTAYGIPSPRIVIDERLELVGRAWNSLNVEEGTAPVRLGRRAPINVPAEAMSWGRDEYKQVMVFYYPTRHTSSPV